MHLVKVLGMEKKLSTHGNLIQLITKIRKWAGYYKTKSSNSMQALQTETHKSTPPTNTHYTL